MKGMMMKKTTIMRVKMKKIGMMINKKRVIEVMKSSAMKK